VLKDKALALHRAFEQEGIVGVENAKFLYKWYQAESSTSSTTSSVTNFKNSEIEPVRIFHKWKDIYDFCQTDIAKTTVSRSNLSENTLEEVRKLFGENLTDKSLLFLHFFEFLSDKPKSADLTSSAIREIATNFAVQYLLKFVDPPKKEEVEDQLSGFIGKFAVYKKFCRLLTVFLEKCKSFLIFLENYQTTRVLNCRKSWFKLLLGDSCDVMSSDMQNLRFEEILTAHFFEEENAEFKECIVSRQNVMDLKHAFTSHLPEFLSLKNCDSTVVKLVPKEKEESEEESEELVI
jgi:hypothetical protein